MQWERFTLLATDASTSVARSLTCSVISLSVSKDGKHYQYRLRQLPPGICGISKLSKKSCRVHSPSGTFPVLFPSTVSLIIQLITIKERNTDITSPSLTKVFTLNLHQILHTHCSCIKSMPRGFLILRPCGNPTSTVKSHTLSGNVCRNTAYQNSMFI